MLTFNPSDVRGIQRDLKGKRIAFVSEADESAMGPGHATLVDPTATRFCSTSFD